MEDREKQIQNFNNAIKWAEKLGFDYEDGKWERQDDGASMTNKELFKGFMDTKKYIISQPKQTK